MLRGISISASGLELSRLRLEASAHNTANLTSAGATRVRVLAQEAPQGGVVPQVQSEAAAPDALDESVAQISVSQHVSLLKKALQIQEEMMGVLLDLRG